MINERLRFKPISQQFAEFTVGKDVIDDNGHLNYEPRLGFCLDAASAMLQKEELFPFQELDIRYVREVMEGDSLTITTTADFSEKEVKLRQKMQRGNDLVTGTTLVAGGDVILWDPLSEIRVFEEDRRLYLKRHGLTIEGLRQNGVFIYIARLHMKYDTKKLLEEPKLETKPLKDAKIQFRQQRGPTTSVCTIAVVTPGDTTTNKDDVIKRIVSAV